jgi:hypothetical protein
MLPPFIKPGEVIREAILPMPGIYRLSADEMLKEDLPALGIKCSLPITGQRQGSSRH